MPNSSETIMNQSLDPAVQQMLEVARAGKVETVWDRYQAMLPQCGFGDTGLCCRHCLQGPCRIDPFGNGPKTGICGATADVMVARGLDRAIAAGTAAHSGHARHLAHTLLKMATGQAKDYPIKDTAKLTAVAGRLGIPVAGRTAADIACDLARAALADFHEKETPVLWATTGLPQKRAEVWNRLGLIPKGIDHEVSEIMHRTLYGVDADPVNLLLAGLRCGVADLAGCAMGTDLADILFGTPAPVMSEANLGTLKADHVNIALHGHNPVLSDILVTTAMARPDLATAQGAAGFNLVGICCTGNEIMMRHGVPSCTHSVSQETALLTGAVDMMVVDYQCIMPSVATVAECTGTPVLTTMELCRIAGTDHLDFTEDQAADHAVMILSRAAEHFHRRKDRPVTIPAVKTPVMAGFSLEAIVAALTRVDPADPLKPLADNLKAGNIRGVCLFAGCNNVKVSQDRNFVTMAKKLLRENVLILATGCGAGALMRHGLMDPARVVELCGPGLAAVLTAIGQAASLQGPLPPVLHLGSCVDNSRAVALAAAVADYLDVDISALPVVASAPEAVSEKAVSIGTYAVAAGLPTHVGVMVPVIGSALVTSILTDKVRDLTGGYFIVDLNPESAADQLLAAIDQRRKALGL